MPNDYSEEIEDGIATMLWNVAWGEHVEDHDCDALDELYVGNNDDATPPPDEAIEEAKKFAKAVEAANGVSLSVLYERALAADAADDTIDLDEEAEPFDFGGDLVFMALGTEMSWFDEHAKFPLVVPDFDNSVLDALADAKCDQGEAVA